MLSTKYFSQVSSDSTVRDKKFKQISLLLAAFGALNLVGHCYKTAFLGYGAVVIHIHNILASLNGWKKAVDLGEGTSVTNDLMMLIKDAVKSLKIGKNITSNIYLLAAYVAIVRSFLIALAIAIPQNVSIKILSFV